MEEKLSIVSIKMEIDKELRYEYDENITNPYIAKKLATRIIGNSDRENFLVLSLNIKHKINNASIVSQGAVDYSLVHPREVFKTAILSNSNKIMFFYNHPSGDIYPSKDDQNLTKRLKECGELLGISLIDHIIVSEDENEYYSFKEHNDL